MGTAPPLPRFLTQWVPGLRICLSHDFPVVLVLLTWGSCSENPEVSQDGPVALDLEGKGSDPILASSPEFLCFGGTFIFVTCFGSGTRASY